MSKCTKCNYPYSTASKCPNCGYSENQAALRGLKWCGLFLAISMVIGGINQCSKFVLGIDFLDDEPAQNVPVNTSVGSGYNTTSSGTQIFERTNGIVADVTAVSENSSNQATIEGLNAFMNRHFNSYLSNNPADWSSLFAEESSYGYYDKKTSAPRSYIFQDRLKYIQKYPTRSFEILDDGKYTYNFLSDATANVIYKYKYVVSGSIQRTGVARVELIVQNDGEWQIIKYNETVAR